MTPYEAWFGKKPHVKHLRVFSCDAKTRDSETHTRDSDIETNRDRYVIIDTDTSIQSEKEETVEKSPKQQSVRRSGKSSTILWKGGHIFV